MKEVRGDRNFVVVVRTFPGSVKINGGAGRGRGETPGGMEMRKPAENCRELFVIPTKSSAMLIG